MSLDRSEGKSPGPAEQDRVLPESEGRCVPVAHAQRRPSQRRDSEPQRGQSERDNREMKKLPQAYARGSFSRQSRSFFFKMIPATTMMATEMARGGQKLWAKGRTPTFMP